MLKPAMPKSATLKPAAAGAATATGKARETSPDRPAYAESDYPHRTFGWSPLRALRTGKYLFIEAPHKELYYQSGSEGPANLSTTSAHHQHAGEPGDAFRQKTGTAKALKVSSDPDPED
jgi:hypothetical protein